MFSKSDAPAPARSESGTGKSIMAADLKISGEITSTGAIEIYGEVDGNLVADTLVVGNDGIVKGTVSAANVEVKGKLDGRVSTQGFTLRASAQVMADVNYTNLVIESGALIEGRFTQPKA